MYIISQQLNLKPLEAYIFGGRIFCPFLKTFQGGTFCWRRKWREDLQSPRSRTCFLRSSPGLALTDVPQTQHSSKQPPILKPLRTARWENRCCQVFQEHKQWPEIRTVSSCCLHQHLATNSALIYLRQLLCLAITNSSQIHSRQDLKFSGLLFGQNPN